LRFSPHEVFAIRRKDVATYVKFARLFFFIRNQLGASSAPGKSNPTPWVWSTKMYAFTRSSLPQDLIRLAPLLSSFTHSQSNRFDQGLNPYILQPD